MVDAPCNQISPHPARQQHEGNNRLPSNYLHRERCTLASRYARHIAEAREEGVLLPSHVACAQIRLLLECFHPTWHTAGTRWEDRLYSPRNMNAHWFCVWKLVLSSFSNHDCWKLTRHDVLWVLLSPPTQVALALKASCWAGLPDKCRQRAVTCTPILGAGHEWVCRMKHVCSPFKRTQAIDTINRAMSTCNWVTSPWSWNTTVIRFFVVLVSDKPQSHCQVKI